MPSVPLQRRGLLGLLLGLPVFARSVESGPPSVDLLPCLIEGQTLNVRCERRIVRSGVVLQHSRVPVRLQLSDVDGGGALLRWTDGIATILDADPQRRRMLEIGLAVMRGTTLAIRLDERGRVQSLQNAGEVRQRCLAAIDAMSPAFAADEAMRPVVDSLLPALKSAFVTDDAVAAASLREPGILLSAMGRRFGADEPVEFRTALGNPFGGPALPAIARFAVRRVERRAQRAELGWLMVSDPVATTGAVRTVVEEVSELAGGAATPELPRVALEEQGDFVVDTQTAWPISVTHTRRVTAGMLTQVETNSFAVDA